MMKLILKGEPLSTGSIYRSVCRGKFATVYMTKKGKDLKEDYQWQIKSQYKSKLLAGGLKIEVYLYFGTKRVSDWDNFHKLSMDAMSGLVYEDDSQIQEAHVYKNYDKSSPRIEILIKTI